MDARENFAGYNNIRLVSPYAVKSLLQLKITQELSGHARIYFTGIIPEGKKDSYINNATAKDKIEVIIIEEDGNTRPLFKGQTASVCIKAVKDIYYIEVEGLSNTFDMDVKLKKRSFQNREITFKELIRQVIRDYPGADFIGNASSGEQLGTLMVQYNETDWQFLKRLASLLGTGLVADPVSDSPRFWFGMPDGSKKSDVEVFNYSVAKNLSDYEKTVENYDDDASDEGYKCYSVESKKLLEMGDHVSFKENELIVSKFIIIMESGVLKYEYVLSFKEKLMQVPILNDQIAGGALEGRIIDVAKDKVRIHLDIDEAQDKNKAFWFPYSTFYTAEGNSGWYCMPQLGDHATLYFPDAVEENAMVVGSVRKGGDSCPKTGNPDIKYFGTNNGKELMLGGKELAVTASGQTLVKLAEDSGVEIHSDKQIMIMTQKDLEMEAEKKIEISAGEALYLLCGQSSIAMDGDTNIRSSIVKMEGYNKSPVFVQDFPPEENEADETQGSKDDNRELILDGVQLALDIVGMIPGVGVFANVANACISAARGNWLEAGLSLVSCIPFAGIAAKGAKVAKAAVKAAKYASEAGEIGEGVYKGAKTALKVINKSTKIIKALSKTKFITTAIKIKKAVDLVLAVNQMKDSIKEIVINGFTPRNIINLLRAGINLHGSVSEMRKEFKPKVKNKSKKEEVITPKNTKKYKGSKNPVSKSSNPPKEKICVGGDPINVATGGFYVEAVDLVLEDRGLGIDIRRSYSSVDWSVGSFGTGWTFEYESHIERQKDEAVLTYPDGHIKKFKKTENGWKNQSQWEHHDILTEDESRGFILTRKDKTSYRYDKDGKLTSICDRNGNTITIRYNSQNEIATMVSPGGKILFFEYSNGKISEITDNIERKVSYIYDGDKLVSIVYPNEGVTDYAYGEKWMTSITDQNGNTYVRNEYDEYGRVIRQYDSEDNKTDIEYNDRKMETTFVYHATGVKDIYGYSAQKLVTYRLYGDGTKETYAYDSCGNVIEETDRKGRAIRRVYDETGSLLEEIYPDGYTVRNEYDSSCNLIKTSASGGTEAFYIYDNKGNLLEERVKVYEGIYGATVYEYDRHGRMLKKTDPENNITTFEYEDEHIGKPSAVKDPEGSLFKYKYDDAGRTASITTDYGTVEFGYNALNKKTHITDAKGSTTRMMYDKMGNLVKKVRPLEYNVKTGDGRGYEYRYDSMDRLVQTIDPMQDVFAVKYDIHGNMLKEINPNYYDRKTCDGVGVEHLYDHSSRRIKTKYPTGGEARVKYDPAGNVIKTIDTVRYDPQADDGPGNLYEYDEMDRLVMITNPDGNVTGRFIYDRAGRITKEINAKGYLSAHTDEKRYGILYKYNNAGWLLEKREPVEEDAGKILYSITLYTYDRAGRKLEEKRSPQYVDEKEYPQKWNTISYAYDKNSRIIKITDTLGAQIEYNYDCLGNRTLERVKINADKCKTTRYIYNSVGQLEKSVEEIDGNDLAEEIQGKAIAITSYEYDRNGNISKVTTPKGYETEFQYDMADRLVQVSKRVLGEDDAARCYYYQYDRAGNIVKETDCNGNSIEYVYDSMNRKLKITDREGGITRLYYDAAGKLIKKITPQNYNPENDDGKGTIYSYDSMDRLVEITNALGMTVQRKKYNNAGELIEDIDAANTGIEYIYNAGGKIKRIISPGAKQRGRMSQKYTYDALGNITGMKDGEGNLTTHTLDAWGRITSLTKADGSQEHYTYDYAGNITSSTDGNGITTEYTYNSLNLLSQIKDPAGDEIIYKYDRQGRLSRYVDKNKRITEYLYNMDDKIAARKEATTGTVEEYSYNRDGSLLEAASGGTVYTYDYTPGMNLKSKRVNGKTVLKYKYDKNNNVIELKDLTGINTRYKYDILGRLEEVWEGSKKEAAYSYNPDGTIAALNYGNGIAIQYSHDGDKNLAGILAKNAEGCELLRHSYIYDNNGNQVEKHENDSITRYVYDGLNRLAEAEYPDKTLEAFTYDRAGNRAAKSVKGLTTTYFYDVRNRLASKLEGGEHTAYEYDAQGNLIVEKGKLGTTNYTYDCFNRTASVQKYDGSYIKNHYDPEGFRSKIEENSATSTFIFDGRNVIAELDEEDRPKAATIRGHELLMQKNGQGDSYYYLNNAHGDVVGLTDMHGAAINTYTYDAFGNTLNATEQVHNRFRYAGEQHDPVTGQYYLRARFYNPVVGRFTQEDEYRGDGLNLYAYVGNNPVNYFDPSGYSCQSKGNVYGKEINKTGSSNSTASNTSTNVSKAGGLFKNQDDAAIDFGQTYNAASINDNKEYVSVIYKENKKEKRTFLFWTYEKTVTNYKYTQPDKGSGSSATVPAPPSGAQTIAILHTHAAYDPRYDNENFSDADKKAAKSIGGYIYVATPGGYLKRYDPNAWFDGTTTISINMPKDPNSP